MISLDSLVLKYWLIEKLKKKRCWWIEFSHICCDWFGRRLLISRKKTKGTFLTCDSNSDSYKLLRQGRVQSQNGSKSRPET